MITAPLKLRRALKTFVSKSGKVERAPKTRACL